MAAWLLGFVINGVYMVLVVILLIAIVNALHRIAQALEGRDREEGYDAARLESKARD